MKSVIGFDFSWAKIDVALADPAGSVLESVRLDTLAERGPGQFLARANGVRAGAHAELRFGALRGANPAIYLHRTGPPACPRVTLTR